MQCLRDIKLIGLGTCMHVCISESLTFWHTLPSKRCSVCVHTGQRFDGKVCQKVKLSLDWFPFLCLSVFPFLCLSVPFSVSVGMGKVPMAGCRLARQVGNGSVFSFSM